jgi:hypothetical protein
MYVLKLNRGQINQKRLPEYTPSEKREQRFSGGGTIETVHPREEVWDEGAGGTGWRDVPENLTPGDVLKAQAARRYDRGGGGGYAFYTVVLVTDERLVLVRHFRDEPRNREKEAAQLVANLGQCLEEWMGEGESPESTDRDLVKCLLSEVSEENLVAELARREAFPFQ